MGRGRPITRATCRTEACPGSRATVSATRVRARSAWPAATRRRPAAGAASCRGAPPRPARPARRAAAAASPIASRTAASSARVPLRSETNSSRCCRAAADCARSPRRRSHSIGDRRAGVAAPEPIGEDLLGLGLVADLRPLVGLHQQVAGPFHRSELQQGLLEDLVGVPLEPAGPQRLDLGRGGRPEAGGRGAAPAWPARPPRRCGPGAARPGPAPARPGPGRVERHHRAVERVCLVAGHGRGAGRVARQDGGRRREAQGEPAPLAQGGGGGEGAVGLSGGVGGQRGRPAPRGRPASGAIPAGPASRAGAGSNTNARSWAPPP